MSLTQEELAIIEEQQAKEHKDVCGFWGFWTWLLTGLYLFQSHSIPILSGRGLLFLGFGTFFAQILIGGISYILATSVGAMLAAKSSNTKSFGCAGCLLFPAQLLLGIAATTFCFHLILG